MNERTLRDRLHALAPFILRMGIAAMLAQNGMHRAAPLVREAPTEAPSAAATTKGFTPSGDWGALLGVGELGAAALLAAGFFTRLCTLPMLAMLGYFWARANGGFSGSTAAGGVENAPAMMLLAIACLTLLVSGSGCASWDNIIASRRRKRQGAVMVA